MSFLILLLSIFLIAGVIYLCLYHDYEKDRCPKGGKHDWKIIDLGRYWRSGDIGFGITVSGFIGRKSKCKKCDEEKTYDS